MTLFDQFGSHEKLVVKICTSPAPATTTTATPAAQLQQQCSGSTGVWKVKLDYGVFVVLKCAVS